MRPIDANALKARLRGCIILMPNGLKCTAERAIDTQGTIEAEPVRHSRWVCVNEKENIWWCDECGGEIQFSEHTPESAGLVFCPYCGAKMDGGADNG